MQKRVIARLTRVPADNVAGAVTGMTGTDSTITIPSVRITLADGNALKALMVAGPVLGELAAKCAATYDGAPNGKALMYAPATFSSGSSVR